jgi:hypothetical protein
MEDFFFFFFFLFSYTKYEISKICCYSGNVATTLRVLLEFQPFSWGNSDYTSCAEELWKMKELPEFL